jgi:hypothetical protein
MATKKIFPAGSIIIRCKCSHEFQDRRYGAGMRVHNAKKAKSGGVEYICTVCKNVKDAPSQPKEEIVEKEAGDKPVKK